MIRLAAYTGSLDDPSSRFRIRQYIKGLKENEIDVSDYPLYENRYPPVNKLCRPFWGLKALYHRGIQVIEANNADATFLQREFISTFYTLERITKSPRIFDLDDAIFLKRKGDATKKIAEISQLIICGNSFLAEYMSKWNSNIVIIPTAVDTSRFVPKSKDGPVIIGWSGSSSNLDYLYAIEPALKTVLECKDVHLLITSDKVPIFSSLPPEKVDFVKWTKDNEVKTIQSMDIGIMPLKDSLAARGKCSYKMLLYMSCGLPVVVSPIGMNKEVLSKGKIGLSSSSLDDWIEALSTLICNGSLREAMGSEGRKVAEKFFSLDVIVKKLAESIKNV